MNSSSIPISIIWSRMNQNIDSVIFSVDVKEISIPKLKRCTLNISPSNQNWKSFSGPVFGWYFNLENITEFDWLIISIVVASIVCTMLTPCISDLIIDIACWFWATSWNLEKKLLELGLNWKRIEFRFWVNWKYGWSQGSTDRHV